VIAKQLSKHMDKKIKILYIHHGKGLGGAPLSLLYLIKGLDKNIYHPLVLFLHDSEAVDLYRAHNIEIIGPLNINDFSHTKIWWFRWYHLPYILKHLIDTAKTLAGTAKTIFKQVRPDLVHLNTSSLWAWAKVAHCMRIPVICHVREPLAEGYLGLRRKLIQHMIKKYTTVIVPICKNDALPWISEDKTTIVYNPVDPQKFDFSINPHPFLKHYTLSTTQPRILFLGGLSEEKGTLLILHVFAKLLTILPDAQLLIAGYFDLAHASSGLRAYLPAARFRKKVAEAIEPRNHAIKLLGPIKNVPEAMAACNVIVFPQPWAISHDLSLKQVL